jgi:flagellar biosynthesis/type III secretory pathway protein FliH
MADLSNRTIRFHKPPKRVSVTYCGQTAVPAETAAEMERVAYERGKADAHAAIAAQVEAMQAEISSRVESVLQSLTDRQRETMEQLSQRLPRVVVMAAQKVIDSIEIEPTHVQSIVDSLLKEAPEGEALKVRLHPQDLALLKSFRESESHVMPEPESESVDFAQALSGLFGGGGGGDALSIHYPGIEFIEDDTLNRGDCYVDSRFGTLDGSIRTRLKAMDGEDT